MTDDRWHWQEPETAWKGVGIYHVTLTVPSREPLLGDLIIPDNDPLKAYIERHNLGKSVIHALAQIPVRHPEIRLLQYCLMPDHMHAVLYVSRSMDTGIRSVIRGFWQGVKKLGREQVLSIDPNSIRNNEQNPLRGVNPIFTEVPFIRPLSRHGQLDAMMQYVKLNPQRLATKRLKHEFFYVQNNVEINGRIYDAVGNARILTEALRSPVHVRHTMTEQARLGNPQPLDNYIASCLEAARKGTVMVSPFISQFERDVLNVLIQEQRPVIYLATNGFGQYYKPSSPLFDAVYKGNMLILSPWQYDPSKKHVSRADCILLNNLAEEICRI